MLYVTTRNNRDAFTANRVLQEDRCPDGGFYLPFRPPKFTHEEIDALADKSFNQNVADILNLFFNIKLTGWDIDFCAGRHSVRLETLRHRIIIAESWHNPDWDFERTVKSLTFQICKDTRMPTDWIKIAVRIAVLFGIFGELKKSGVDSADVSVLTGDFTQPISAWYARQWGLPVGNIICSCNENNTLWDLLCHGQMRTDAVSVPTIIPEADVTLPAGLERLIYECGGGPETLCYLDSCRKGRIYCPNDAVLTRMRKGMYVSVVSSHRTETTIPSVYRTHSYVMSGCTALAYSGLLDYRAKTGETGYAVVLAEKSPVCDAELVAKALGIPVETLRQAI